MISTNYKKLYLRMWSLKDHGKKFSKVFYKKHKIGFRWLHDYLGSNHRMTEMQAAIGREQLKLLDKQIKKRHQIANMYINGLKNYFDKYDLLKNLILNVKLVRFTRKKIVINVNILFII